MILVSKPFNGLGFGSWKRAMEIALTTKNKLGFNWERCNSMVISWILNALSSEIAGSIVYMSSASEMWLELIERFGQLNGSSNIITYYTRIKGLWDEIQTLCNLPQCSCGASQELHKLEEGQKLMQFLMGLNESYTVVRGTILMMKPLPSVRQAYSLLIQEEKQREIGSGGQFTSDVVSFNAEYRKLFCDYCRKAGHTKEKCYKLHGFPNHQKFNKDKRFTASL
ncbi:Zinc finger CCHC-type protein [Dioscorea alata]|uniref:Zinc finger CCHC-type protein n=1 Tax=Dioscorea alata TaxID=55571 RepID=A0ACB7VYA5_DIOAL|nr:Zinc finger CCHC-type protein [Dioscorea alata]